MIDQESRRRGNRMFTGARERTLMEFTTAASLAEVLQGIRSTVSGAPRASVLWGVHLSYVDDYRIDYSYGSRVGVPWRLSVTFTDRPIAITGRVRLAAAMPVLPVTGSRRLATLVREITAGVLDADSRAAFSGRLSPL